MTELTRRTFLTAAVTSAAAFARADGVKAPVAGADNPDLEPFDKLMATFIAENEVPGASLAVTRNGKLVYARGFGYADVEKQDAVQPASLFRIASVSKPLTAVAILQLVEKGKLKLDDKVWDRMKLTPVDHSEGKPDGRWKNITIRHCLQHTGGWDRDKSYDPIGRPTAIAKAFGKKPPASPEQIVRYMMARPLDFDPGERYAYSNLGYLVLGRILETATGGKYEAYLGKYEAYLKKEVLAPLGIKRTQLGRALLADRVKGEVKYYDAKKRTGTGLYPPLLDKDVPIQYGAANFEGYEAHGGWIASAVDLVRFASAFDDPAKSPLLNAKSIEAMWARPAGAGGHDKDDKPKASFYGCGWMVRPVGNAGKVNAWHTGWIAGTEAILVRRSDGLTWAVLFNTANNPAGKPLAGLIDGRLHEAAGAVKRWPVADQFPQLL